MKFVHLYLNETTTESFEAITHQTGIIHWIDYWHNIRFDIAKTCESIVLDLPNIVSEKGEKLLGLRTREGFSNKEEIIILDNGKAELKLNTPMLYAYPIWSNPNICCEKDITVEKVLHSDEYGLCKIAEYNVTTPYGTVRIYTGREHEIIDKRHLHFVQLSNVLGVNVFIVDKCTFQFKELPKSVQDEIAKRIGWNM